MEGDNGRTRSEGGDCYRDESGNTAESREAIGYNDGAYDSGTTNKRREGPCKIDKRIHDSRVGRVVSGRTRGSRSCGVSSNQHSCTSLHHREGSIEACVKSYGSGSEESRDTNGGCGFKRSQSAGFTKNLITGCRSGSRTGTENSSIEKDYALLFDGGRQGGGFSGRYIKNYDPQTKDLTDAFSCNRPRTCSTDTSSSDSASGSSRNSGSKHVVLSGCCSSMHSPENYAESDSCNNPFFPDTWCRRKALSGDRGSNNTDMIPNSNSSTGFVSTPAEFFSRTDFVGNEKGVGSSECINRVIGLGSGKGVVSARSAGSGKGIDTAGGSTDAGSDRGDVRSACSTEEIVVKEGAACGSNGIVRDETVGNVVFHFTRALSSTNGRELIHGRRIASSAQSRGRRRSRRRSKSSRLGGGGTEGLQRDSSNRERRGTGGTSIVPRHRMKSTKESDFCSAAATSNAVATDSTAARVIPEAAAENVVAHDVDADGAVGSTAAADASWLSRESSATFRSAYSGCDAAALEYESESSCSASAAFPQGMQSQRCFATGDLLNKREELAIEQGGGEAASTYILYLEPSPSCALSDRLDCHAHQVAALWGPDPAQFYPPHCSLSGFFECRDIGGLKKLLRSFFGNAEKNKEAQREGEDFTQTDSEDDETALRDTPLLSPAGNVCSSDRNAEGVSIAAGVTTDKSNGENLGFPRDADAAGDVSDGAGARVAVEDAWEAANSTSATMNASEAAGSEVAATDAPQPADSRTAAGAATAMVRRPAAFAETDDAPHAKKEALGQLQMTRGYMPVGLRKESALAFVWTASSAEAWSCPRLETANMTLPTYSTKGAALKTTTPAKTAAARGVLRDRCAVAENYQADSSSSYSCECTTASGKWYCFPEQQPQPAEKPLQGEHTRGQRIVWQHKEQQHQGCQQHQEPERHDVHQQQERLSQQDFQKHQKQKYQFLQPHLRSLEKRKELHQQQRLVKPSERISNEEDDCNGVCGFDNIRTELLITRAAACGARNSAERNIPDTRPKPYASEILPRRHVGLQLVGECCCSGRLSYSCVDSARRTRATEASCGAPHQQGRELEVESAAPAQPAEGAIAARRAEKAAVQSERIDASVAQAVGIPAGMNTTADPAAWLCPLLSNFPRGEQRHKILSQEQHSSREVMLTSRSSSVSTCSSASKCGPTAPNHTNGRYKSKRKASANRWNQRRAASSCLLCTRGRSSTRLRNKRVVMVSSRSSVGSNSRTTTCSSKSSFTNNEAMRGRDSKRNTRRSRSRSSSSRWAGTRAFRRRTTSACRLIDNTGPFPVDGVSVNAAAAPAQFFRSFALRKLNLHTAFFRFWSAPQAAPRASSRCMQNSSSVSNGNPVIRTNRVGEYFFTGNNNCVSGAYNSASATLTNVESRSRNRTGFLNFWGRCSNENRREWASPSSPISVSGSTGEKCSSILSFSENMPDASSSSSVGTSGSEVTTCNINFSPGKNSGSRWCVSSRNSSLFSHGSSWGGRSDTSSCSCSPKKADSPSSNGRRGNSSSEGLVVSTDDGYVVLCLSCYCLQNVMEQLQQKLQEEGKIRLRKKRGDHVTLASHRREPSIREAIRAFYEAKLLPEEEQILMQSTWDVVLYRLEKKTRDFFTEGRHQFVEILRFPSLLHPCSATCRNRQEPPP